MTARKGGVCRRRDCDHAVYTGGLCCRHYQGFKSTTLAKLKDLEWLLSLDGGLTPVDEAVSRAGFPSLGAAWQSAKRNRPALTKTLPCPNHRDSRKSRPAK
ncbi:MAG: hypothetical protein LBK42_01980 [Propionibacteriaceae bacterium]|jgi:hypothetical protein|nr:hypothetical protein [Propionibacteriaceae bacterium]